MQHRRRPPSRRRHRTWPCVLAVAAGALAAAGGTGSSPAAVAASQTRAHAGHATPHLRPWIGAAARRAGAGSLPSLQLARDQHAGCGRRDVAVPPPRSPHPRPSRRSSPPPRRDAARRLAETAVGDGRPRRRSPDRRRPPTTTTPLSPLAALRRRRRCPSVPVARSCRRADASDLHRSDRRRRAVRAGRRRVRRSTGDPRRDGGRLVPARRDARRNGCHGARRTRDVEPHRRPFLRLGRARARRDRRARPRATAATRTYQVVERAAVRQGRHCPPSAIWTRGGPETLVLITCGGSLQPRDPPLQPTTSSSTPCRSPDGARRRTTRCGVVRLHRSAASP